uniref:Odorant receptor n=2 Tax=Rhodnius prolixus TaxID=13249 RepID=T1HDI5_RHOPR
MVYSFLNLTNGLKEEDRLWFLLKYSIRFLVTAYLVFSSGTELFWGHGDIYVMVDAFSSFLITFNILIKVITVLLYRKEIRQLYDRVEHLHMDLRKDEEHHLVILDMERFTKTSLLAYKIVIIIYPLYSFITNFVIDYKTDFKNLYSSLKLYTYWPVTNLWSYTPSTLLVLFISCVTMSFYGSFIALELVFAFEITAFLKVLQGRLNNMNEKDENIYGLHRDIIKLVTDYNALLSGQMYWEIVISSVEPCGYGFTFIKAIKSNDPAASELFFKLMLVVTSPFILCACGQLIRTEFEKLHEATYMSPWYEQNPPVGKNLAQMMVVTAKPSTIGYKGIIVFDYSCFSTVAQGIYTYIMMIFNFDTDE